MEKHDQNVLFIQNLFNKEGRKKKYVESEMWPVSGISALQSPRQKDHQFQSSFRYTVSPSCSLFYISRHCHKKVRRSNFVESCK